MIESIWWPKNFPGFFQFINDILTENGSVFWQVLNRKESHNAWVKKRFATDQFIDKYIFPNGVLPEIGNMLSISERSGLHLRLFDNSLWLPNAFTTEGWYENLEKFWPDLIQIMRERGVSHNDYGSLLNPFLISSNARNQELEKNLPSLTNDWYYQRSLNKFPYDTDNESLLRVYKYYLLLSAGWHRSGIIWDSHVIWEKNPENIHQNDINIPQTLDEVKIFLDEPLEK
jgi:hypothetical protein